MTGSDDDGDEMMTPSYSDAAAELLLAGGPAPVGYEQVEGLLAALGMLADLPAPAPSAKLAKALSGPTRLPMADLSLARDRRRPRLLRVGVAGGVVATVLLGSVGAAAAHGRLPDPAQNAVADAIAALSPFSVPHARPRVPTAKPVPPLTPAPAKPSDVARTGPVGPETRTGTSPGSDAVPGRTTTRVANRDELDNGPAVQDGVAPDGHSDRADSPDPEVRPDGALRRSPQTADGGRGTPSEQAQAPREDGTSAESGSSDSVTPAPVEPTSPADTVSAD